jgi:hypothetical protein
MAATGRALRILPSILGLSPPLPGRKQNPQSFGGKSSAKTFRDLGEGWNEVRPYGNKLRYDAPNLDFLYRSGDGSQARFHGFDPSIPVKQRGILKSLTKPAGQTLAITARL